MIENIEPNDAIPTPDPSPAPTFHSAQMGQVLQAQREAKNWSYEDVASRLRLSVRQIKALESNDFAALPDPMITRGFIRNYAKLLEIDAESLLVAYRQLVPTEELKPLSLYSSNVLIPSHDRRTWAKYIVASICVLLLGLAWIVYNDYYKPAHEAAVSDANNTEAFNTPEDSKSAEVAKVEAPKPEEAPAPALPAAERSNPPALDNAATSAAAVDSAPAKVATVEAPAAKPAAGSNAVATETTKVAESNSDYHGPFLKIQFSFTEDSWVSVTDGSGKQIYSRMRTAGSSDVVQGQPPLKLLLGNAAGSQVIYQDKVIDLTPYTKLNVARLTLALE
jgi:cytoskeleton protein RodZ